jgi:hypothetical protein
VVVALAWSAVTVSRAAVPDTIRVGGPSAPADPKVAIVASEGRLAGRRFTVRTSAGRAVLVGTLRPAEGSPSPWRHAARADLSEITSPGSYGIEVGSLRSPPWKIDPSAERELLRRVLRVFAVNADGREPNPVFGPSHLNDAVAPVVGGPTAGATIDVEGGWRDAGDAIKFTTTTAIASALLDYSALLVPDEAEALRERSDVGVRWLRKAHPAGTSTFVAQVGDESDHVAFRDFTTDDASPNPGLSRRKAYGDAGSGPLGAGAAALALAASRPGLPQGEVSELRARAEEWYARGKAVSAHGPALGDFRQPGDPDMGFYSDWQGYMALAAGALHRLSGEDAYLDDARAFLGAVDAGYGFNPYFHVGPIAAADLCGGLGRPAVARADVRELACDRARESAEAAAFATAQTAFGSPGGFYFGWVQGHTGNAALAAAAERAGAFEGGRALAAQAHDYLLGLNPWGASFVVGPEEHAAHAPYHPLFLKGDPVELGRGLVVGGPAVESQFPDFGITPNPGDRFAPYDPTYDNDLYRGKVVYEDQPRNFINSEVGLAYSSPTVLLLAELSAR